MEKVEDVVNIGEKLKIKVMDIDPKTGKISLSHKDLIPREEQPKKEKIKTDEA